MNKKHLFWIIPLSLIIGYFVGDFLFGTSISPKWRGNYPMIECIMLSQIFAREGNRINNYPEYWEEGGISKDQREAIQWICSKELVNLTKVPIYENLMGNYSYKGTVEHLKEVRKMFENGTLK